jgi:hypothetical protein
MSKKNANPYRNTKESHAYHDIFNDIRKAPGQIVTRSGLIALGHSPHDVTVVLGPRDEGKSRGDCRGNMSAQGHLYFMDAIKKPGEEKKFRLRWRKTPLDPRKRVIERESGKTIPADTDAAETAHDAAETAETVDA